MPVTYVPIAVCPGCDQDVLNDDQGRVIDAVGATWHRECRKVELRKQNGSRRGDQSKASKAEVTA